MIKTQVSTHPLAPMQYLHSNLSIIHLDTLYNWSLQMSCNCIIACSHYAMLYDIQVKRHILFDFCLAFCPGNEYPFTYLERFTSVRFVHKNIFKSRRLTQQVVKFNQTLFELLRLKRMFAWTKSKYLKPKF